MLVVIFRAKLRELDPEYSRLAVRLRELARDQFGCLEFIAVSEAGTEIALSYWPDEASVRAWKQHAEHMLAQELGRKRWYDAYTVQVARVERDDSWSSPS